MVKSIGMKNPVASQYGKARIFKRLAGSGKLFLYHQEGDNADESKNL